MFAFHQRAAWHARILACVAAGTAITTANASATPPTLLAPNAKQRALLTMARPLHATSWMSPSVSSSTAPLLYLSIITSASTGETLIYQQQGRKLVQVGQLSEGGGPIAVDRNQNVYVAESGTDVLGYVPRNIYVYARGATTPTRVLKNANMSWTIGVGYDGTVYVASLETSPSTHPTVISKYAPGATKGTPLPVLPVSVGQPTGIVADSSGKVYLGFFADVPTAGAPSASNPQLTTCLAGSLSGCLEVLPSGANAWTPQLMAGSAINSIMSGPVLGANSLLFGTLWRSTEQYLITFPRTGWMPSRVKSIPPTTAQLFALAFAGDGNSLWTANVLLNGSAGYRLWHMSYPDAKVSYSMSIPQNPIALPSEDGIAVSPAYYP
jgi:hypothetical protein